MKTCSKCKVEKPLVLFHKNKTMKDGLNHRCKLCRKQYCLENAEKLNQKAKQWQIDNIDKKKQYDIQYAIDNAEHRHQYDKQWRQTPHGKRVKASYNHKRRVSLRNNTLGKHFIPADLIMKLKLQESKCVYCNVSIKDGYHIDHIIPPCDGGGNEAWNIQLLCAKCNMAKHDNPAHEYAQKHGMLI